jgi:hypothetical protein
MGGCPFGLGTRKSGDEELRDRWQRPGEDFIGAGAVFHLRDGWMLALELEERRGKKKKQVANASLKLHDRL